jgi:hypothetical protein
MTGFISGFYCGVRVTRSLVFCVVFYRSLLFVPFLFGHCIFCHSIYVWWLPLCYLPTLLPKMLPCNKTPTSLDKMLFIVNCYQWSFYLQWAWYSLDTMDWHTSRHLRDISRKLYMKLYQSHALLAVLYKQRVLLLKLFIYEDKPVMYDYSLAEIMIANIEFISYSITSMRSIALIVVPCNSASKSYRNRARLSHVTLNLIPCTIVLLSLSYLINLWRWIMLVLREQNDLY